MSDSPKIGAGHASAMARLGLRELRNAAVLSRDGIADTEMGLYGSRTPGEVSDIRHSDARVFNSEQERVASGPELSR